MLWSMHIKRENIAGRIATVKVSSVKCSLNTCNHYIAGTISLNKLTLSLGILTKLLGLNYFTISSVRCPMILNKDKDNIVETITTLQRLQFIVRKIPVSFDCYSIIRSEKSIIPLSIQLLASFAVNSIIFVQVCVFLITTVQVYDKIKYILSTSEQ
jgi:hypothetical protein